MKRCFKNINEFRKEMTNFNVKKGNQFSKRCENTIIDHIKKEGAFSVCGIELTDIDTGEDVEVNELYIGESGDLVLETNEGICYEWDELAGIDKLSIITSILKK